VLLGTVKTSIIIQYQISSLSISIIRHKPNTIAHQYIQKDYFMDQLRKHPNDGLDDSPAAGVKSRTRVRRRRASSHHDIEPRRAAKRRCTKDLKATVEAKFGAQVGDRLVASAPLAPSCCSAQG